MAENAIPILLGAVAGAGVFALLLNAILRRFLSRKASAGVVVVVGVILAAVGVGTIILAAGLAVSAFGVWMLLAEPPTEDDEPEPPRKRRRKS